MLFSIPDYPRGETFRQCLGKQQEWRAAQRRWLMSRVLENDWI